MAKLRMTDVLVAVLLTAAAAPVAVAALRGAKETEARIKCAQNLKQIGQALLLYANENRNAYPRTTVEMGKPPVWGTPYADDDADAAGVRDADPYATEKTAKPEVLKVKPKPNDVTAAMYQLLRTQDLVPDVFICPSSSLAPLTFPDGGSVLGYTNWRGKSSIAKHLSYSYQNPYPSADAIGKGFKLNNSITAEFAVAADMNPGGEGPLKVKPTDAARDLRQANSLNHGGDGQNVLYGDGHVEFVSTPFVGVKRDNIYVANDRGETPREGEPAIVASPADANDSILLPTAADVGQVIVTPEPLPIEKVDDPQKLMAEIVGTYDVDPRRGPAGGTLTIDAKTITIAVNGQTHVVDYRVLGRRAGAVVVEITPREGNRAPLEHELRLSQTLSVDGMLQGTRRTTTP